MKIHHSGLLLYKVKLKYLRPMCCARVTTTVFAVGWCRCSTEVLPHIHVSFT